MEQDTLTLALEGDVPLADFAKAMGHLHKLITALARDIDKAAAVDWRIDDLQAGSAIATVLGRSQSPETIGRIVTGYGLVGQALEQHQPIPFSPAVRREARAIEKMVNGAITAVRFETASVDAVVRKQAQERADEPSIRYAYGAVRGFVQTLTSRRGVRFTLYDTIFDTAISCYLRPGDEELVRGAWGQQVLVTGRVGREAERQRVVVIREIERIDILPPAEKGSFRLARGVVASERPSAPSEVIVQRMRDG